MRHIGFRFRTNRTKNDEKRPSQVYVLPEKGKPYKYDLADVTSDLDFVIGKYPTGWHLAKKGEDADTMEELEAKHLQRHLQWRELKDDENINDLSVHYFVKTETKTEKKTQRVISITHFVLEIPTGFDGLMEGDIIGMTLGSGNRVAFALSRRAEILGGDTAILRITPSALNTWRDTLDREKKDDAQTLAELVRDSRDEFCHTVRRDRDLIRLHQVWQDRQTTMHDRMAMDQRQRAYHEGIIFCSEEGLYPAGRLELAYQEARANDQAIQLILAEEERREKDVLDALRKIDAYNDIFEPIVGIGPLIAARFIVTIGDIRRFSTAAKFKKYMSTHVRKGGKEFGDTLAHEQFSRSRRGQPREGHPDGKDALYQVTVQFVRQKQSPWNAVIKRYKAQFTKKYEGRKTIVRAGIADAYRSAEQLFVDSGITPPRPTDDKITTVAEFNAWLAACLQSTETIFGQHKTDDVEKRIRAIPVKNAGGMLPVYSKGHIHNMALKRTGTKFAEWLWKEWTRYEREKEAKAREIA